VHLPVVPVLYAHTRPRYASFEWIKQQLTARVAKYVFLPAHRHTHRESVVTERVVIYLIPFRIVILLGIMLRGFVLFVLLFFEALSSFGNDVTNGGVNGMSKK
jgi:hypothetical protein